MKTRSTLELATYAFHEAGHAVAAFALGGALHQVSIVPGHVDPSTYEPVSAGQADAVLIHGICAAAWTKRCQVGPEQFNAMWALAGPAAEAIATGKPVDRPLNVV